LAIDIPFVAIVLPKKEPKVSPTLVNHIPNFDLLMELLLFPESLAIWAAIPH